MAKKVMRKVRTGLMVVVGICMLSASAGAFTVTEINAGVNGFTGAGGFFSGAIRTQSGVIAIAQKSYNGNLAQVQGQSETFKLGPGGFGGSRYQGNINILNITRR